MSDQSTVELQARWDKIRIANLYDTLDEMGYPNQCLDLGIKPLFPHQHLAGHAVTVTGRVYPVPRKETQEKNKDNPDAVDFYEALREVVYPGCCVVVSTGGEAFSGKFGEMTSWGLQQNGARGIVLDTLIRDLLGLEVIPNYTVAARGTTPIESAGNWRIEALNVTVGMPGTLTSQVRVDPGDWIVGGPDGVMVVPQAIAMETLEKVEDMEAREQGMREDLAAGMSFEEAFEKWGRA